VRKCDEEEQAKEKGLCDVDCCRENVRAKSPHSEGCRTTPGNGAMTLDSTRENVGEVGDGGVTVEPDDELESKLPVEEQDPPREEIGLRELLERRFWQL
jgi:hypothetical protein